MRGIYTGKRLLQVAAGENPLERVTDISKGRESTRENQFKNEASAHAYSFPLFWH